MAVVVCDAVDASVAVACQGPVAVVAVLTVCVLAVMEVEGTVVVECLGIVRDLHQAVAVVGDGQVVDEAERAVVLHAEHDMIDACCTLLAFLSWHYCLYSVI